MAHSSAPLFNGKIKREIAAEAFRLYGPMATIQQVDDYFRKYYKLPYCERSMYHAAKRRFAGRPEPIRRQYPRKRGNIADVVVRTKELATAVGGFDELQKLIEILKLS